MRTQKQKNKKNWQQCNPNDNLDYSWQNDNARHFR